MAFWSLANVLAVPGLVVKYAPMRSNFRVLVGVSLLVALSNCATATKYAPLSPLAHDIPVPMQQEQIASAARAAVAQSVSHLELADLVGKQVRVQVSGSYAPSEGELLDFVGAVTESELAMRGIRIEPRAVPHAVLLQQAAPTPTAALANLPDFVASVTLDAAGVDLTSVPQTTGPIVMMGVGGGSLVLGGLTTLLGATGSTALIVLGLIVMSVAVPVLIAGIIWAAFAPNHYLADARVKLGLTIQPVNNTVRAQTQRGEGNTTVRYEPNKSGGLKARAPLVW
jgi:hypothetical protein